MASDRRFSERLSCRHRTELAGSWLARLRLSRLEREPRPALLAPPLLAPLLVRALVLDVGALAARTPGGAFHAHGRPPFLPSRPDRRSDAEDCASGTDRIMGSRTVADGELTNRSGDAQSRCPPPWGGAGGSVAGLEQAPEEQQVVRPDQDIKGCNRDDKRLGAHRPITSR